MSDLTIKVKPSIVRIWINGILAAIVAVLLNVILFFAGSALRAFPEDVLTPMGIPVDVVAVILNTTLSCWAARWFTLSLPVSCKPAEPT